MTVHELLQRAAVEGHAITGPTDRPVTGVEEDSRRVGPGTVFVARRGHRADGHAWVADAIAAGAAAVVADTAPPSELPEGCAWVRVADTSAWLGPLAGAWHDHPSRAMTVLAVTGTNGKTTTAWLLHGILRRAGRRAGLIGTVEVRIGDTARAPTLTTPSAPELQRLLAEMRDAGCTHAVLEASSHGLEQDRLAGTRVAVGGFTGLSREHLDHHGSEAAYRAAKERLFRELAEAACLRVDDETGRAFAEAFDGRRRTVSATGRAADLRADEVVADRDGVRARLAHGEGTSTLRMPLVGRHNLDNGLVALGMAELAGIPRGTALEALARAEPAPGRLEPVGADDDATGPRVLVDYAHSPDALARVLDALRPLTAGRLVCVFGVGGDRDPGKRPEMGRAADARADVAVLTSDNPRTEDPNALIDAVAAGMAGRAERIVEPDRRAAIHRAVELAGPDDVVLVAGKGHEQEQTIGTRRHPFDDRRVAREALAARTARAAEKPSPREASR